jgi:hypothetical protein
VSAAYVGIVTPEDRNPKTRSKPLFARVRAVNQDLVWLNLLFLLPAYRTKVTAEIGDALSTPGQGIVSLRL